MTARWKDSLIALVVLLFTTLNLATVQAADKTIDGAAIGDRDAVDTAVAEAEAKPVEKKVAWTEIEIVNLVAELFNFGFPGWSPVTYDEAVVIYFGQQGRAYGFGIPEEAAGATWDDTPPTGVSAGVLHASVVPEAFAEASPSQQVPLGDTDTRAFVVPFESPNSDTLIVPIEADVLLDALIGLRGKLVFEALRKAKKIKTRGDYDYWTAVSLDAVGTRPFMMGYVLLYGQDNDGHIAALKEFNALMLDANLSLAGLENETNLVKRLPGAMFNNGLAAHLRDDPFLTDPAFADLGYNNEKVRAEIVKEFQEHGQYTFNEPAPLVHSLTEAQPRILGKTLLRWYREGKIDGLPSSWRQLVLQTEDILAPVLQTPQLLPSGEEIPQLLETAKSHSAAFGFNADVFQEDTLTPMLLTGDQSLTVLADALEAYKQSEGVPLRIAITGLQGILVKYGRLGEPSPPIRATQEQWVFASNEDTIHRLFEDADNNSITLDCTVDTILQFIGVPSRPPERVIAHEFKVRPVEGSGDAVAKVTVTDTAGVVTEYTADTLLAKLDPTPNKEDDDPSTEESIVATAVTLQGEGVNFEMTDEDDQVLLIVNDGGVLYLFAEDTESELPDPKKMHVEKVDFSNIL